MKNNFIFPFWTAKRYLVSRKSTNVITMISMVAMGGIAVIATALILVLSVFNGFESLVISLYNTFNPDILVTAESGKYFVIDEDKITSIKDIEGVSDLSFTLEENVLLKYDDKQYVATMKGVDTNYSNVTGVDSTIIRGEYALEFEGKPSAIIGAGVEAALGVNVEDRYQSIRLFIPKRGDKTYLNPSQSVNSKSLIPTASFSIQQDFDTKYIFVDLSVARGLIGSKDEVSAIEFKLSEDADFDAVKENIINTMGPDFVVKNRFEQNMFLYQIMNIERWAVYIILSLILLIASFNIIGSLSMVVIEKKLDISILKSMGATSSMVHKIYLYQGLLMSLVGLGVGFIISIAICVIQMEFGLLKIQGEGTFVISAYPVEMRIVDFILVSIIVCGITLLASWLPAKRAAATAMFFKEA